MSITVNFLNQNFSFPDDIQTYIVLCNECETMTDKLISAFIKKVQKQSVKCISDEQLHTEMQQCAEYFISRLCENNIFTRSIDEYMLKNSGYDLYSQVNHNALEVMKTLLKDEIDYFQKGMNQAIESAASNIVGSRITVYSSSSLSLAAHAMQEYSIKKKQAKKADEQYRRELSEVINKGNSRREENENRYLSETYFPEMEKALTMFVYSMMDRYLSDLSAAGKFNVETYNYVDINKSNNLLKNLKLTSNKEAVLASAFITCPYNSQVYIDAYHNGITDDSLYNTAYVFGQAQELINEWWKLIPTVSYPCDLTALIEEIKEPLQMLSRYSTTGIKVYSDVISSYKSAVIEEYRHVKQMSSHAGYCCTIVQDLEKNGNLECDDKVLFKIAHERVKRIISDVDYVTLVDCFGCSEIVEYILPSGFSELNCGKAEIDDYYISAISQNLRTKIEQRKKEIDVEKQKECERKAQQERLWQEQIIQKKERNIKRAKIVLLGVLAFSVCITLYLSWLRPIIQYKTAQSHLASARYQEAINLFSLIEDYKDSDEFICQSKYLLAKQYMTDFQYSEAVLLFNELDDYIDSKELLKEAKYALAQKYMSEQKYDDASKLFAELGDYSYSNENENECKFLLAMQYIEENNGVGAFKLLNEISSFEKAKAYLSSVEAEYQTANNLLSENRYAEAACCFYRIRGYKDTVSILNRISTDWQAYIETYASELNTLIGVVDNSANVYYSGAMQNARSLLEGYENIRFSSVGSDNESTNLIETARLIDEYGTMALISFESLGDPENYEINSRIKIVEGKSEIKQMNKALWNVIEEVACSGSGGEYVAAFMIRYSDDEYKSMKKWLG